MATRYWQPEYMTGITAQRDAERLFNAGVYGDALPLYEVAAKSFRNALPVNWVRVFFCEATALRCLEAMAAENPALSSEYQAQLQRFLLEWPVERIRSHVKLRQRCEEALVTRAWRESAGHGTAAIALAVQYAMIGNFDTARAVLDEALQSVESQVWLPARHVVKRILQSKRIILDVFEEQRKPEALHGLRRISYAYATAARVCRLRPAGDSVLEVRLRAFRAFYLSHLAKWLAFADLRDLDKGYLETSFALRRAAARFQRAVRLADAATGTSQDETFPRFHPRYLNLWGSIIRMRASLFRFMETGEASIFDDTEQAWFNAVQEARALSEQGREDQFFPNRLYSLADLENEYRWLQASKAFKKENWEVCYQELCHWDDEFPDKYKGTWRHRQGRVRLVFLGAFLRCLRGETGPDKALLDEIDNLRQSRFHRGIGRVAEQLLDYASAWARLPAPKHVAIALARECGRIFPFDARIAGEPLDQSTSRIGALPDAVASQLLQPLVGCPRDRALWRAWFFAACANLLGYLGDYYKQASALAHEVDVEELNWQLPNGIRGTMSVPKQVANQIRRFYEADALNILWAGQDSEMESAYAIVYRLLEQTVRIAPVVIEVAHVEQSGDVQTAVATPDWHSSEISIELVRLRDEGEPIATGMYYLPPEYGAGFLKNHYRVRSQAPLFPVSYVPSWDVALDEMQRLDFTTLFRNLVAVSLAAVLQGEAEQEKAVGRKGLKTADVDILISRGQRIVVVAEVGVSFRNVLSDAHKVRQAADARVAVEVQEGSRPVGIVVTNVADVSPVIEAARNQRVRIWQTRLDRAFSKCVRDPRQMRVLGFTELFPCPGADAKQIELSVWPTSVSGA